MGWATPINHIDTWDTSPLYVNSQYSSSALPWSAANTYVRYSYTRPEYDRLMLWRGRRVVIVEEVARPESVACASVRARSSRHGRARSGRRPLRGLGRRGG